MVNLKEKPFYLNEEEIKWVEDTLASMTLEEKIGQLFVQMSLSKKTEDINKMVESYHQGGLRYQGGDRYAVWKQNRDYQKASKVPLLIACNCDNGGDGAMSDGTFVATAAQAAAGQTTETAYHMGLVTGREATAIGCNWTFNPCSDIFMNWRNTIVNTRCFGDNADTVVEQIRAYIKGVHESNMACCCKHFPGDGVEERDQHLVLGVNDLSVEEWNASFRKVYQTMIDEGLESIMVGHIALPEMTRKLRPGIKDEDIMPATLSPELLNGLLRQEMGFNGVIITDASHMGGFSNMMKREQAVPLAIAAGCDMFLFVNDAEEDIAYMKAGIENGIISEERFQDALHRILGLKAHLKLYKEENVFPAEEGLSIVGCKEHKAYAEEAAKQCITLVKDTKKYLPLDVAKKKRAKLYYLFTSPNSKGFNGDETLDVIVEELTRAGFEVDVADNFYNLELTEGVNPMNQFRMMDCGKMKDYTDKYEVAFVFVNVKGYAQENNVRLRFSCGHSNEMPWYVTEVPTIGISLNYTTHLIDLPQIHTFINAYGANRTCIRTAIEKVCGRGEFTGKASDTVFCGKWDTRL